MKAYREKLKLPENEEKLEEYRARQRIHDKNYSNKMKQTESLTEEFNLRNRDRQRRYRERKKNDLKELQDSNYDTISAKSKAIKKAEKALPKNPNKRSEIAAAVAQRNSISILNPVIASVAKPRKGFRDVQDLVIDFYSLDMISRQLPGIRDYVTVKNTEGGKEKVQKRALVMSLADAHLEFKKMFEDKSISFSKFCQLRPSNVDLMCSDIQHSCLCAYCENMKLLLESLSRYTFGLKLELKDLSYKFNCHNENFDCISGVCSECADLYSTMNALVPLTYHDEMLNFKEWQKVNGYMQKVLIQNSTVRNVMDKIVENMVNFKFHYFLKKVQQQVFHNLKQSQDENHATLVVDYAENYTSKVQNEIQSSYFARKQLSLFTCVAYIGNNSIESFLIVNDNTLHSKDQVFVYLKKILKKLKEKYTIDHVSMFSDGCASQFKNRCSLSNLLYAMSDFGVTMNWNFFCTSHGKSAADGIGGTVKRGVHYRVLSDLYEVYTAADFVKCANSFVKKITVFEVDQKEVTDEIPMLQNRWKNYKVIPGTQNFHFFKPSERAGYIYAANSSLLDGLQEIKFVKKSK